MGRLGIEPRTCGSKVIPRRSAGGVHDLPEVPTLDADDRRSSPLSVDPAYSEARVLRAGHLTHGYATTIHKLQGLTCDDALLLADDGIFQEAGYTALTRGRERNHLYAVACEPVEEEMGHGPPTTQRDPIETPIAALERTQVKTMGIDNLTQRLRGPELATPPQVDRALGIDL